MLMSRIIKTAGKILVVSFTLIQFSSVYAEDKAEVNKDSKTEVKESTENNYKAEETKKEEKADETPKKETAKEEKPKKPVKKDIYEDVKPPTLGATLSIAHIPHLLHFDLEKRFPDYFSIALGAGGIFIPYNLQDPNLGEIPLTLKIIAPEFKARIHPFGGSFFIGAGLGQMRISAGAELTYKDSKSVSEGGLTVGGIQVGAKADIGANINALYVAPQLGWQWVWNSGFTMGMDFGVQLPVSVSTSVTLNVKEVTASATVGGTTVDIDTSAVEAEIKNQSAYKDIDKLGNETLKKAGEIPLPVMSLIKIGWLF